MKKAIAILGLLSTTSTVFAQNALNETGPLTCENKVSVYLGENSKSAQSTLQQILKAKGQVAVMKTKEISLRSTQVYKLEEGLSAYVKAGTQTAIQIFDQEKLEQAIEKLSVLEEKRANNKLSAAEKEITLSSIFSDVLVSKDSLADQETELLVRFSPFEALNYFGKEYDPTLDIVAGRSFEVRISVDANQVREQLKKEIAGQNDKTGAAEDTIMGSQNLAVTLGLIQTLENGALITAEQRAALYAKFAEMLPTCK